MKKLILSSALVLALCLSFTSCREKKEADTTTDGAAVENAVEETTDATEAAEGSIDDATEAVDGAIDDATKTVKEAGDDANKKGADELNKAATKLKKDN